VNKSRSSTQKKRLRPHEVNPLAKVLLGRVVRSIERRVLSPYFIHWKRGLNHGWASPFISPTIQAEYYIRGETYKYSTHNQDHESNQTLSEVDELAKYGKGSINQWRKSTDKYARSLQYFLCGFLYRLRYQAKQKIKLAKQLALEQKLKEDEEWNEILTQRLTARVATANAVIRMKHERATIIQRCWIQWCTNSREVKRSLLKVLASTCRKIAKASTQPPSARTIEGVFELSKELFPSFALRRRVMTYGKRKEQKNMNDDGAGAERAITSTTTTTENKSDGISDGGTVKKLQCKEVTEEEEEGRRFQKACVTLSAHLNQSEISSGVSSPSQKKRIKNIKATNLGMNFQKAVVVVATGKIDYANYKRVTKSREHAMKFDPTMNSRVEWWLRWGEPATKAVGLLLELGLVLGRDLPDRKVILAACLFSNTLHTLKVQHGEGIRSDYKSVKSELKQMRDEEFNQRFVEDSRGLKEVVDPNIAIRHVAAMKTKEKERHLQYFKDKEAEKRRLEIEKETANKEEVKLLQLRRKEDEEEREKVEEEKRLHEQQLKDFALKRSEETQDLEKQAHADEILHRKKREKAEKLRLPIILSRKNEWWAVTAQRAQEQEPAITSGRSSGRSSSKRGGNTKSNKKASLPNQKKKNSEPVFQKRSSKSTTTK